MKSYASTTSVSGLGVDAVVKELVVEKMEEDKEGIEDAGETLASVKSELTFKNHEKKLHELKCALCTRDLDEASIEWESGDYCGSCTADMWS